MRPTETDEPIPVRVNYVARGYGLALTISEESEDSPKCISTGGANLDQPTDECSDGIDLNDPDLDSVDNGFLTVVEAGVTTLELRRPDGQSSYLIWDESEVTWDSLQAG